MALNLFDPPIRDWFTRTLGQPTPAQSLGWPAIAAGKHALILAPTGSGKTLAAFLWAIQSAMQTPEHGGVHVLYVSPLKALNNDVERNLRAPLDSIAGASHVRVAVRTGDTPQPQRREMVRRPPHILITTPELLFILLTSPERESIFSGLKFAIIDEIHSVAGNKRGAHLSLSLERGEWRGHLRRGHFLDSLAGMQFALPEAVERLRAAPESGFVLLSACDPASPYCDDRIRRRPANQVLFQDGVPVLYTENHGSRWWILGEPETAIPAFLERWTGDPLTLEEINGYPAAESPLAPRGFTRLAGGALRQGPT
ncbi:MAG: DEAD/DEAH box helicase [Acidobacteria bacterium]|nr:DEAD/DEAH box helicase [Acidobacteriota bacterium]